MSSTTMPKSATRCFTNSSSCSSPLRSRLTASAGFHLLYGKRKACARKVHRPVIYREMICCEKTAPKRQSAAQHEKLFLFLILCLSSQRMPRRRGRGSLRCQCVDFFRVSPQETAGRRRFGFHRCVGKCGGNTFGFNLLYVLL